MAGRRVRGLAVAVPVILALAACGGSGDGDGATGEGGGSLLVWTTEDQAERVAAQKKVLGDWASGKGLTVELVPVAEDQLSTVLTSAAAADKLPDAIAVVPIGAVQRLATDQLIDTEVTAEVVSALGEDTFTESALALTRNGEDQLAIPSDGWTQMLYYRKDLFEAAGLQPPTSYDAISAAAAALDRGDVTGIVAATAPADSFTQQTFEHIALANDCELTDDGGKVVLDSPECVKAYEFYTALMKEHSAPGNQDADTTRAAYFAGRASMIIWSTFLLDELAALRNDALPTCRQCRTDKKFLVENTGIVPALKGPDAAEPAAYGEVVSWTILTGAAPETKDLVQHVLSDGYADWLAVAPEGKVPLRPGNAEDPEAYVKAWRGLKAGVDTKAPLADFYDAQTLEAVVTSPQTFARWGIPQGQGPLVGALAGQFVVPKALSEVINGGAAAADAAKKSAEEARTIQEEVAG
jgi:multiple sugar transport system substrate-binding protein